jgi:DnaJ-domain-containing protein 1
MNAYELADLIGLCGDGGYNQDAANMLRQQADYIAQLEKGLESSIAMNKAQAEQFAELERRYKEEFDYAERLLKERSIANFDLG